MIRDKSSNRWRVVFSDNNNKSFHGLWLLVLCKWCGLVEEGDAVRNRFEAYQQSKSRGPDRFFFFFFSLAIGSKYMQLIDTTAVYPNGSLRR